VRWFSNEKGWGVLDAPEAPGGIFVHFSAIEMEGNKSIRKSQLVEVEMEGPFPHEQDGCYYRAKRVRPAT
jgi:CspA family cold shock protein